MDILILLFVLVIGMSFLCSVLESILLSTNASYVAVLEEKDPSAGKSLKALRSNIDQAIASILILNTFANTLGATAIGVQAQKIFGSESSFVIVVSIVLTFLILFVAEIIPKTIGAVYWKELAPMAARMITFFVIVTKPIIIVTQFVTKKISNKNNDSDSISREELIHSTLISEEDGIIDDLESDIIENILSTNDKRVRDILTPRSVMFTIKKGTRVKHLLDDKKTFKFSRVPIYEDDIDNIIGVVLTKKIFRQAVKDKSVQIEKIMHPIYSINENIPVSKALSLFIKRKEHIFLVVDNYGQTDGIVTLEDCIETFLGFEIMDESDTTEDMRQLALSQMKSKRKERESQN